MGNTILLLNPVYATLFWALVLNFYNPVKNPPKTFLGKFMIVSFVLYISHFFYFSGLYQVYYFLDGPYMFASLLVFPLYHIYIRLLTIEKKFSIKLHGKFLLLPVVVFVLYQAGVWLITPSEHISFLKTSGLNLAMVSGAEKYLYIIYLMARILFVMQVFFFSWANFALIVKNNRQLQDFYSNTDDRKLQWVQFFNISLAAISIASIAAAVTGREAFATGEFSLAGPSLVFSIMLFSIGLLGNTQKTVHTDISDAEIPNEYTDAPNLPEPRLKAEMEKLFEEILIFKNPDLKIWDLSQKLGTNRTYISRFINQQYNRNFCNHVNHYRVQYMKQVLLQNPDLPNEQLAEISGFGSVSSLYRAFQTTEGLSLGSYRKGLVQLKTS